MSSPGLSPLRPSSLGGQPKTLVALTGLLVGCFAWPLFELLRFALHSQLFSHILLIPFISLYLVWIKKGSTPREPRPHRALSLVPFSLGLIVFSAYWYGSRSGVAVASNDHLTWTSLSFLFCFVGLCIFCLGLDTLRAIAFPLSLLIFIVPFPGPVVDRCESFLQHASAVTADGLFSLTGMSFLRDGLVFQLPGIRLEVAPECSGIHSTLVLLITSLVAGHLFLRAPWKRVVIALAVIPLGILRNGVRICTIGQLCVHVSPDMINSPIHHRGGPLFFAVSLVPVFLLLYYLRRSELRTNPQINLEQQS